MRNQSPAAAPQSSDYDIAHQLKNIRMGLRHSMLPIFNFELVSLDCVGKKFPLDQANEAIEASQREARGGKVFLEG